MWQQLISKQYGRPSGPLGHYIGLKMIRDHRPENNWTLQLLQAQPTDHILELGFGAGFAISQLARLVTAGRLAGLDRSLTMVRLATLRNWWPILRGRVQLHHGDVTHLPFADASFDKLFSIHSIYFWQQPQVALEEIWRVLRPGGTLTLTILPKERWPGGPDAVVNTTNFHAYTSTELQQMPHTIGFHSPTIHSDPDTSQRSNFSLQAIK